MSSHSQEPWQPDDRICEGVSYSVMLRPDGKILFTSDNSEVSEIHEDFDEEGFRTQWDQQARDDFQRASVCVNACTGFAAPEFVPAVVAAAQSLSKAIVLKDAQKELDAKKDLAKAMAALRGAPL
jgi:hypothetical protein